MEMLKKFTLPMADPAIAAKVEEMAKKVRISKLEAAILVNRGITIDMVDETMNISLNDIVDIRFCTLDHKSWEYWSDFEEIQSLSRNPFFPVTTDIRSNIEGGLGYWAGYGSTYYTIEICSPE